MFTSETKIRVRYSETDQMGYVYYGNYPAYYEVGRTEMIREIGFTYDELEKRGVMLPVASLSVKYMKPGRYDDLLTIRTRIKEKPNVRINFEYQVYNQFGDLLNTGTTTLIFVNAQTRKPMRAPDYFMEKIEHYFD